MLHKVLPNLDSIPLSEHCPCETKADLFLHRDVQVSDGIVNMGDIVVTLSDCDRKKSLDLILPCLRSVNSVGATF